MTPIWQGLANPTGIEFGELPRLETQRLRILRRLNEHKEGLSLDELADLATVGELRSIHEAGLITKTSDNKRLPQGGKEPRRAGSNVGIRAPKGLLINDRGRKLLTSSRRS